MHTLFRSRAAQMELINLFVRFLARLRECPTKAACGFTELPKWATLQGKTVVSPRTTSISCEIVSNSGSTTWLWGAEPLAAEPAPAPKGGEDCNTEWTSRVDSLLSSLFNGPSCRNGSRPPFPTLSNESCERDRPGKKEEKIHSSKITFNKPPPFYFYNWKIYI